MVERRFAYDTLRRLVARSRLLRRRKRHVILHTVHGPIFRNIFQAPACRETDSTRLIKYIIRRQKCM